jgi:hypothetical protein
LRTASFNDILFIVFAMRNSAIGKSLFVNDIVCVHDCSTASVLRAGLSSFSARCKNYFGNLKWLKHITKTGVVLVTRGASLYIPVLPATFIIINAKNNFSNVHVCHIFVNHSDNKHNNTWNTLMIVYKTVIVRVAYPCMQCRNYTLWDWYANLNLRSKYFFNKIFSLL